MPTLLALFRGFGISLGLALAAIRLAPCLGLLDVPGGRRRHGQPVARVGGLALVLALLFQAACQGRRFPIPCRECMVVLAMAALGLVDDHFDLDARWKAALGLGLAFLLAWSSACGLAGSTPPLRFVGVVVPDHLWATFPLLVLMYWGLPQGFNLIDGANGLAVGFALVVLGSLWGAGYPHPFLAGALLACLALNWPRARLFLGDCGSLSMGLFLVLLAKTALLRQGPNHILWLFAYPIADVAMVVAIRFLRGQKLGVGDRNHFHFQIMDRWPRLEAWTAPILLALAAMCGSEIYLSGPWLAIPRAGLVLLAALAAGFGLRSLPAARPWPRFARAERELLLPDGVQEDRQGHERV
jgi:UDP-GlcNAc:undecaprenyl-phosphate GlcNAc-1-phosphate transferase